jgi:hypothetical protein
MVHAELDHRNVRSLPQLQQREWKPDVVVEVALVPEHPVARAQQLRDRFLGRGLAGAAGDRHHRASGPAPDIPRHALQGESGVLRSYHRRRIHR